MQVTSECVGICFGNPEVNDQGILVQKDSPRLVHHHSTSGLLGMHVLGHFPDIRDVMLTIKTHFANPNMHRGKSSPGR